MKTSPSIAPLKKVVIAGGRVRLLPVRTPGNFALWPPSMQRRYLEALSA